MPIVKKPITNGGGTAKFVNGVMIPPGETRHVDVFEPAAKPALAPVRDPNLILTEEVQSQTAKTIIEQIPELTDEVLNLLERLEDASADRRKTVMEAIVKEQLDRAKEESGKSLDETPDEVPEPEAGSDKNEYP